MALQALPVRELMLGKEAGVIFTVLVVLWLGSQGDLDPASLLFIYLTTIGLTGLFFVIQSVTHTD